MKAEQHGVVALDVETTGLTTPNEGVALPDEIIQLAIVADDGSTLFNEYFRPEHAQVNERSQMVNGITTDMVGDKPSLSERVSVIQGILDNAHVYVFYNADFDTAFLAHQGLNLKNGKVFCMMRAFSKMMVSQSSPRRTRRWYSLKECMEYFHVKPVGKAHDALTDAWATMLCYQALSDRINDNERRVTTRG